MYNAMKRLGRWLGILPPVAVYDFGKAVEAYAANGGHTWRVGYILRANGANEWIMEGHTVLLNLREDDTIIINVEGVRTPCRVLFVYVGRPGMWVAHLERLPAHA